jgi:hypothetical protein
MEEWNIGMMEGCKTELSDSQTFPLFQLSILNEKIKSCVCGLSMQKT